MTNLLYGNEYLYRLSSASGWLGMDDDAFHWAVLASDSGVTFWFEPEGNASSGSNVLSGDGVFLATQTPGNAPRYLGVDPRSYARWDLVGPLKTRWVVQPSGIAVGDPIPIYAPLTLGTDTSQHVGSLAAASDAPYLQLQQVGLVFTSEDS